ncbi:hypothetical protein BD413DRAFT_487088 [Trametes elegans]|nr:hypothetical protein BD413DRAFT_487088 [Trametes elegans]
MTTLNTLPTELVLRILAYLPLQSLRNVRLLSRRWNEFVNVNESTVYHHAALLHNFVDSLETLLSEAKEARCLKFLQDVPDWYQYCRKYFQLQKNWTGAGSGTPKFYGGHPYDVHRIKVDEKHGLVITTHEFGGLTVFDMETTKVLWRLGTGYVRRYAHCEYENGFLIFDRVGTSKEVWRLETLYSEAEEPLASRPNSTQMAAWRETSQQWSASAPRGHFRPWALIDTPEFGRAYRFVYPDLLVSALRKAYAWDVRTGELVLELENVQGDYPVGDINYVELSATHVFICSSSALRIFSRENKAMVLEIPSYQLSYADVRLAVQLDPAIARRAQATPGEAMSLPAVPTQTTSLYTASYAEFSAVHVSRTGTDIITQLSDSRLVVIRDFMRVARGEVPLKQAALEIGKILPPRQGPDEHFSIYLAFEHGRAGVVTTSGVYVMTLDPTEHGVLDPARAARENAHRIPRGAVDAGVSFPHIVIAALPFYHDRRQLARVTCVQMTETKLFFVWDAMYKPDSIDFFTSMGVIGPEEGAAPGPAPAGAVQAGDVQWPAGAADGGGVVAGAGDAPDGEDADEGWEAQAIAAADVVAAGAHGADPAAADVPADAVQVDWVPLDEDGDEDEWEDEEDMDDDDAADFDDQDVVEEAALEADVAHPFPGVRRGREWSLIFVPPLTRALIGFF